MLPFLSSQCLTLGSRLGTKLVNTKALYNVFCAKGLDASVSYLHDTHLFL
ncbi:MULTISPECIES: hypothetical protein [unclassified Wolbachia]|nr:hypothetical protein [Wolbachia endosymbiont (group A) of Apoderus coryli]